jgi:tetratricopeptide (TPR) repeat protein
VLALAHLLSTRLAIVSGEQKIESVKMDEITTLRERYLSQLNPNDVEILALDAVYARSLVSMKNHEQARQLLEALLAQHLAGSGKRDVVLMTIYLALGQVADLTNKPEKACEHLHAAKKHGVEFLGSDAEWVAKINLNLSSCQKRLGQVEAAVGNLKEALRIVSRNADSMLAQAAINYNLGLIYFETGQHKLALPHVRKSNRLYTSALGPEHPNSISFLIREGALLSKLGNLPAASIVFSQIRSLPALKLEGNNRQRVEVTVHESLLLLKSNRALSPQLTSMLEKIDETILDPFAKDAFEQLRAQNAIKSE